MTHKPAWHVISETFYKHLPYEVKLLKYDDTAIVNAIGSNLSPVSQFYSTIKLHK